MNAQLAQSARWAEAVIAVLRQAGITEDDPDFAALFDAECDMLERLRRMLRQAREIEATSKGLAEIMREMRGRRERFDKKAEGLREAVAYAMQECGLRRLDAPDFTATLSAGNPYLVGVEAIDPAHLPDVCCNIKREASKTKIRAFLDGGQTIEGVSLGNPEPVLTVRTR